MKAAYLFGSTVYGKTRLSSDVDIAVRFTPDLSAEDCFDLRLQLMDELEGYFNRSLDIAGHIISRQGMREPRDNKDLFSV
ncbi:MAG: nucleotidyltransferase domain-containing protein [Deltaproteobacteria bacterium]|nr:nucleotidyltransferase domain-containing protein [Deltaproteobacteria bacterium]